MSQRAAAGQEAAYGAGENQAEAKGPPMRASRRGWKGYEEIPARIAKESGYLRPEAAGDLLCQAKARLVLDRRQQMPGLLLIGPEEAQFPRRQGKAAAQFASGVRVKRRAPRETADAARRNPGVVGPRHTRAAKDRAREAPAAHQTEGGKENIGEITGKARQHEGIIACPPLKFLGIGSLR